MEDDKLAAYYDELTRKGVGAARFKQGLGFSSSSSQNDTVPSRGSALPTTGSSSSSFLSGFVKASSPSSKPISESKKQAQLQSIQDKLSKKQEEDKSHGRVSRRRSRSRDRYSRRRSRSWGRRGRSRSREKDSRRRGRSRSRSRSGEKDRERRGSPEEEKKRGKVANGGGLDFAKLINGYDAMTPAERVKAKMKLQLSRTAENDETIGKGSGWERFDFDKDAPLDDEEEIEAAEDDAAIVKNMGQSFRFSAVEARKDAEIQAAHDEAMFGAPSISQAETESDAERERSKPGKDTETSPSDSLLSEQVLTMPKGFWRHRVRKA